MSRVSIRFVALDFTLVLPTLLSAARRGTSRANTLDRDPAFLARSFRVPSPTWSIVMRRGRGGAKSPA